MEVSSNFNFAGARLVIQRPCMVCSHRDLDRIEQQIREGRRYYDIGMDFDLDESAIYRHKKKHMSRFTHQQKKEVK